jgi:hypothetical protein
MVFELITLFSIGIVSAIGILYGTFEIVSHLNNCGLFLVLPCMISFSYAGMSFIKNYM